MSNEITFILETGKPDANGDIIMPSAFKDLPKKVKMTKDFDHSKVIGHCEVFHENNQIKGRAEISSEMMDLTPAIGFQVLKSHREGDITVIEKLKLYCVSLIPFQNADPNIKSIKEQLGG